VIPGGAWYRGVTAQADVSSAISKTHAIPGVATRRSEPGCGEGPIRRQASPERSVRWIQVMRLIAVSTTRQNPGARPDIGSQGSNR